MPLKTWNWAEFVHNLHVKMSFWQSTWPGARISMDPAVDRSWIDTLFHLRACSGARLDEVRPDQREKLVGHYIPGVVEQQNTCFFGELGAAGIAQSVIRHPSKSGRSSVVKTIEKARAQARALPRRPTASKAIRPWKAIASIDHFGPASASRLLMADRPDLYLMLNSKSRAGLARELVLGLPNYLQMPAVASHYESVLEAVYETPWWHEDETAPPRPLMERFLWDGRAALIDVFVYDPKAK